MLGVIHRDEEGEALLEQWLQRIDPAVITLEFSRYGLAFRQNRGERYRMRIEETLRALEETGSSCETVRGVLSSYVNLPYEYVTASQYAEIHNIPLYLVDIDFFSSLKLKHIEELLSPDNIRQLQFYGSGEEQKERLLARLALEKNIAVTPYSDEMYTRDKYMSDKIRALRRYYRGKRFLHVCGWQHLKDPCNLYEHLNPVKVFAHDKAFCF